MTRRRVTPEERALWRRAASTVRPLHENNVLCDHDADDAMVGKTRKAGASSSARASDAPSPLPSSEAPASPARRRFPAPADGRDGAKAQARAVRAPDPFGAGDPRAERLVRRGRRPIDAVFDLHGHTQSSARAALYGFLMEARARHYACVLVITGKGVRRALAADAPRQAGVLRARFKDWMREEAFRQHVVRVSPAHERHGGGGAFYVFLRRKT